MCSLDEDLLGICCFLGITLGEGSTEMSKRRSISKRSQVLPPGQKTGRDSGRQAAGRGMKQHVQLVLKHPEAFMSTVSQTNR